MPRLFQTVEQLLSNNLFFTNIVNEQIADKWTGIVEILSFLLEYLISVSACGQKIVGSHRVCLARVKGLARDLFDCNFVLVKRIRQAEGLELATTARIQLCTPLEHSNNILA